MPETRESKREVELDLLCGKVNILDNDDHHDNKEYPLLVKLDGVSPSDFLYEVEEVLLQYSDEETVAPIITSMAQILQVER